jgi:hypothetical protein
MKKSLIIIFAAIFSFVYSSPIENNEEPIEKFFDAARDVRILLSTRNNPANPQQLSINLASIQQSFYNPQKPLRILIHGWQEDDGSDISVQTSSELLQYNDYNVIFIDWSQGSSTINYVSNLKFLSKFIPKIIFNKIMNSFHFQISAANRVPSVGRLVANLLDFLHENNLISWNRVGLVGFSLGED